MSTGDTPSSSGTVSLPAGGSTLTTTPSTSSGSLVGISAGHDHEALRRLIAEEVRRLSSPSGSVPPVSLAHIPLLAGSTSGGGLVLPPSSAAVTPIAPTITSTAIGDPMLSVGALGDKAFSLTRASIPIPAKLVVKIQALKFVDMRELLPDNIKLLDRLESMPSSAAQVSSSRQREVPNIQTWVCAFCTFIAIVVEAHPGRTRELLAYMQNLVRDASRYGGEGWRTYDYVFRSQAASDPSRSWAEPDTSLVLSYMARPGTASRSPSCDHCFDIDHSTQSCALAPFTTPAPAFPTPMPKPQAPQFKASASQNICISWNQGACALPGSCRYRHVCASCPHPFGRGEKHMAKDCQLTPDDSLYKRPPKRLKGNPKGQ